MKPDMQIQEDVLAIDTGNVMQRCQSCGWPIRDGGTPAYREWCDSMRRLFVLKTVQPEQCHRSCFIAALTAEPASKTAAQLGGCFRNSALRRSNKVEFTRRRQHATLPAATMTSAGA